ncbi:MAG TPA: hypothetical protein VGT41_02135 [Candidatus Babeliales bacterium]|nr:hypothetical protein [Candidatus Babeliales bacterium]
MNILSEWKDSLSLLYPANIKLFLLVTLNTLRQTFVVWIRYYWSFILLYSVFAVSVLFPEFGLVELGYGLLFWGTIILTYQKFSMWLLYYWMLLLLVWFLLPLRLINVKEFESFLITIGLLILLVEFIIGMRPSVGLKNYEYFDQYAFHSIISVALLYGVWQLCGAMYSPNYAGTVFILLLMVMAVLSMFTIMFFLDGKVSIKNLLCSIYRALKMFLYNLPFICLLLLLGSVAFLAISKLFFGVVIWLASLVNIAMYPNTVFSDVLISAFLFCVALVAICFFGNLYVKKSQEQYKLYFDK